jgi:hypothetical protein
MLWSLPVVNVPVAIRKVHFPFALMVTLLLLEDW